MEVGPMLSALAAHSDFLQVLPQLASYGAGCLMKKGTSIYNHVQVGGWNHDSAPFFCSCLVDTCQTCLHLKPLHASLQEVLLTQLQGALTQSDLDSLQLPEGCCIDLDWCMGSPSFADGISNGKIRKPHMLWLLQSSSTVATSENTAVAMLQLYLDSAPAEQQQQQYSYLDIQRLSLLDVYCCIRWPYVSPWFSAAEFLLTHNKGITNGVMREDVDVMVRARPRCRHCTRCGWRP
jgi:hypothetical protein